MVVIVSHAITMPLYVQLTLSHFARSIADLVGEESFPQPMLRTTMDIDCPEWLEFFHGGLRFRQCIVYSGGCRGTISGKRTS